MICTVLFVLWAIRDREAIESKDDLRARGMPSPDEADALSLTFFSGVYGYESDSSMVIIPRNEHRTMFI